MPELVTTEAERPPAVDGASARRADGLIALAVTALGLTVICAIGGVLWERLWDAPTGIVYQHRWFLDPAGPDHAFSATGLFVVIGLVAGLLPGLVLGWRCRDRAWWVMAGLLLGSVAGAWAMYAVGHGLGPDNPAEAARTAEDFVRLPAEMTVARTGFLATPLGAMFGLMVGAVCLPNAGSRADETGSGHQV